jgi:hypothetical protein
MMIMSSEKRISILSFLKKVVILKRRFSNQLIQKDKNLTKMEILNKLEKRKMQKHLVMIKMKNKNNLKMMNQKRILAKK